MIGPKVGSPAEVGVFALLAVLADPTTTKERLKALQNEQEAARVMHEAATKHKAEANFVAEEAAQLSSQAHQAVEKAAERMRVVQAAQQAVTDQELALEARLGEVVKREEIAVAANKEIGEIKVDLAMRESVLTQTESEVAALKADYEAKLEKLRSITTGA